MSDLIGQFRVLLVDDDERQLRAYRTLFNPREFHSIPHLQALIDRDIDHRETEEERFFNALSFTEVTQGQEAVEKVKEAVADGAPFCLAFLDMRMPPGINGLETAKQIRAIDPTIYLVFVTAFSDVEVATISREINRNVLFLHKPFNADEVQQIVRNFIFAWKTDREVEALNLDMHRMLFRHLSNALVYDVSNPALLFLADKINAQQGLLRFFHKRFSEETEASALQKIEKFFQILISEAESQSLVISLLRSLFVDEQERTVCSLSHIVADVEALLPELACLPNHVSYSVCYESPAADSYPFYKRHLMIFAIEILRCLLKRANQSQAIRELQTKVAIRFSIGLIGQEVVMKFQLLAEDGRTFEEALVEPCFSNALAELVLLIEGRSAMDGERNQIEVFFPQKALLSYE